MYPIIKVPDDAFDLPEQLGTKQKFWYRNEEGQVHLFKQGRPNTGENWAEKVCCEICSLLGLPHAHYDFATWRELNGVVTPKFVPENYRLVHGNELLARMVAGYQNEARYGARQHTVSVVMAIMRSKLTGMPLGYVPPAQVALASDVFTGYLMLDALVANQDRHHQNWGLIVSPERKVSLTPTFDHAASLGRSELDEVRLRRLNTKDMNDNVEKYVERARSALYRSNESPKPLSTLDAFREAAKYAPTARDYWLGRLQDTSLGDYSAIIEKIPASVITEPSRRFALRMLEINRGRLLQEMVR